MASNGGMKRQYDGGDDFDPSKRQRNSQPASRVVFVCGLPADCLESELLALCCPFAVVEKSLMIPQKRQAFVQLPDVTSAANLVTFYQTRDALIRGKKIFFEFSNRNEITVRTDNDAASYQQQPPPRASAYQQPPPMQYTPRQDMPPFRGDGGAQPGLLPQEGGRRGIGPPNQILMVSVSKIEYDVTVDVLQQVFQKFGNVEKIVTFWKDNEFKALVQMESVDQAQAAQSALDGRDIYTGCNQLSIVFSRHPELRVRYNDDRSRDYTNPNLPPGPGRGGDDLGESNPVNPAPSDRRDVPRDDGYNNPPPRRDDYRGPTDAPNVRQGDRYVPDMRDNRGPSSRYDERPPSVDRSRDLRSGRELPPHSTGRAIRGDTRPSPALICSNIDRELVVSAVSQHSRSCCCEIELMVFLLCHADRTRIACLHSLAALVTSFESKSCSESAILRSSSSLMMFILPRHWITWTVSTFLARNYAWTTQSIRVCQCRTRMPIGSRSRIRSTSRALHFTDIVAAARKKLFLPARCFTSQAFRWSCSATRTHSWISLRSTASSRTSTTCRTTTRWLCLRWARWTRLSWHLSSSTIWRTRTRTCASTFQKRTRFPPVLPLALLLVLCLVLVRIQVDGIHQCNLAPGIEAVIAVAIAREAHLLQEIVTDRSGTEALHLSEDATTSRATTRVALRHAIDRACLSALWKGSATFLALARYLCRFHAFTPRCIPLH